MHLERLLSLLEMIAVAGRPVGAMELQRASGLPRPTCYRLLQTLADHGLAEAVGDGYAVGERVVRLALLGVSDRGVSRAAAPILRREAARLGDSVFLSRLRMGASGGSVEIVHVETPPDPGAPHIHPGLGVRPLHACSCGKAIAAFAEPAFLDALLAGRLPAFTERTKVAPEAIRAELAEIRSRGYAVCDQEIETGVVSVAAPIRVGAVGVTFSVGAVGAMRRYGAARRAEVGESLIARCGELAGAIQLSGAPAG